MIILTDGDLRLSSVISRRKRNMKSIVILTYGDFPNGDASSIRLHGIAQLFIKSGMKVRIISMSKRTPFVWQNYNGIDYISIRSIQNDLWHRMGNVLFFKRRARKILASVEIPDALMVLGIPIPAILMCERLSKSKGCELYTDRTEWYSPSEFALGYFSPQYIQNDLLVKKVINKKWKVIAISKYLQNFYEKKGIRTVRIPAIMDTHEFMVKETPKSPKTIVLYAGSPAKKDSLAMMIESLKLLDTAVIQQIEFRVIGVTKDKMSETVRDIPKQVVFHGRVPRERVLEELRVADFATLLRDPSERFTKAGFPSKVAESLSSSTPMITNLTSDLGDYLIDGKNAIIVEDYSREAFAKAILRATTSDKKERKEMQENARETAVKYFDYRVYEVSISQLLSM